MNALSHTHKHALARQCLPRERRGCDTTITQGSVAVSATVVIDGHEAGKRIQANNGCRMHAQPHLKTEVPLDAS